MIIADLSADLSDTRAFPFLARMSVGDARVFTCKRELYTISYRVGPTRLQLHDRRISNVGVGVRVGVGLVEFQLNAE